MMIDFSKEKITFFCYLSDTLQMEMNKKDKGPVNYYLSDQFFVLIYIIYTNSTASVMLKRKLTYIKMLDKGAKAL